MTEPTRWVIIDDRDGRIQYSGTWASPSGSDWNNQGNFGQTYLNTLHTSNTDGSSFSFRFTGNAARIMGTNNLSLKDDVADIDWDCILDGRTVTREKYFPYTENNWVFCSFSNLVAGEHTIGLRVKTQQRAFLFDQIQYRPSGTVQNEVIAATRDDADLQYSSGWAPLANVGHNTLIRGSTATFRFVGTGVSLWAMYPKELPRDNGDATYTLDGGSAVSFTIPGGGDMSHYNRRIFSISGLSQGAHTITLQYTSTSSGSTPLVIGQFLIEQGTNLRAPAAGSNSGSGTTNAGSGTITTARPADTTTTTGSSTALPDIIPGAGDLSSIAASVSSASIPPAHTSSGGTTVGSGGGQNNGGAGAPGDSSSGSSFGNGDGNQVGSTSKQAPIGAIIGAVLGALALILLVLGLLWYRRRRRIRLERDAVNPQFSMTRDGHMQEHQHGYPSSPFGVVGQPNQSTTDGSQASHSLMTFAPPSPHPAAQTKRGPVFNSQFISNHDPYRDSPADPFADSTHQLIPSANNTYSPSPPSSLQAGYQPQRQPALQPLRANSGHQHSGSISASEAPSSNYSNVSSARSGPVYHEDSGIRLPATAAEGDIVEYPPMYSYR